jgi:1-deoxy-D-xylulose-5-phosphate synthase
MAPADENELQHMLKTAFNSNMPCAIRYPRGAGTGAPLDMAPSVLQIGKAKVIQEGGDVCLLGIGNQVANCIKAAEILEEKNIKASVVNMRFLKPLDEDIIKEMLAKTKKIVTAEENVLAGGFGESVKALLCDTDAVVECIGLPDKFIEHGSPKVLREKYGLTAKNIAQTAFKML